MASFGVTHGAYTQYFLCSVLQWALVGPKRNNQHHFSLPFRNLCHRLVASQLIWVKNLRGVPTGMSGLSHCASVSAGVCYVLELQTEGEGWVLPSLEAQVTINPESREIGIELRAKVVWSEAPAKRIICFPDPESVGAHTAVAT